MRWLNTVRQKPDSSKNIILWTIIIVLGIILGSFWLFSSWKILQRFGETNIKSSVDIIEKAKEFQESETMNLLKQEMENIERQLNKMQNMEKENTGGSVEIQENEQGIDKE